MYCVDPHVFHRREKVQMHVLLSGALPTMEIPWVDMHTKFGCVWDS